MKIILISLSMIILFMNFNLCLCQEDQKSIVIKVSSDIMKNVPSRDNKLRFYTSARNPISKLTDILDDKECQIGAEAFGEGWSELGNLLVNFLGASGISVSTYEYEQPGVLRLKYTRELTVVGSDYFKSLFIFNPKLRLFLAAIDDTYEEELITEYGGGIRIIFELDTLIESENKKLSNLDNTSNAIKVQLCLILVKTISEANAVLLRLKNNEDFAKLAKELSIGPNFNRGGDVGEFNWEDLSSEYKRKLSGLSKDEYSDIVTSDNKYIILFIKNINPDSVKTLPKFE